MRIKGKPLVLTFQRWEINARILANTATSLATNIGIVRKKKLIEEDLNI